MQLQMCRAKKKATKCDVKESVCVPAAPAAEPPASARDIVLYSCHPVCVRCSNAYTQIQNRETIHADFYMNFVYEQTPV